MKVKVFEIEEDANATEEKINAFLDDIESLAKKRPKHDYAVNIIAGSYGGNKIIITYNP